MKKEKKRKKEKKKKRSLKKVNYIDEQNGLET